MWNKGLTSAARALTVEVHVPGVIAVLVLPDGLANGADQRDSQQAAKQHQDLQVGDSLHIGQLQGRPSGILGNKMQQNCNEWKEGQPKEKALWLVRNV